MQQYGMQFFYKIFHFLRDGNNCGKKHFIKCQINMGLSNKLSIFKAIFAEHYMPVQHLLFKT